MSLYMISAEEIRYIIDIIEELIALADPSEYLEEEVNHALTILKTQKYELNNIDLLTPIKDK